MPSGADNPAGLRPDDVVAVKLRRAWRKERRWHHIRGASILAMWLVAMILLDFVVDWLFNVPPWGRVVLLVLNVVALGAVFCRNWYRCLLEYKLYLFPGLVN